MSEITNTMGYESPLHNKPMGKTFGEISYENKYGLEGKCKEHKDEFLEIGIDQVKLIEEIRLIKGFDNYFFYLGSYVNKNPFAFYSNYFPSDINYTYIDPATRNTKTANLRIKLNKRACHVSFKNPGYLFRLNVDVENIDFSLRFVYTDALNERNYNITPLIEGDYSLEEKYEAVIIATNNVEDFLAVCRDVGNERFAREEIIDLFVKALKETKDAEKLKFIYENIPYSLTEEIGEKLNFQLLSQHFDILSAYDTKGYLSFVKDASNALLINLQCQKKYFNELYQKLYSNPRRIKEVYQQLDGSSMVNGIATDNRTLYATILTELCFLNFEKVNFTGNTYFLGKGYSLNSNVLISNDDIEDKILLQKKRQVSKRIKEYPIIGMETGAVEVEREIISIEDVDDGTYFHPLDMVILQDLESGESLPLPAIFVKSVSDQAEWVQIYRMIRIGADIVALIIGVASLGSASPLVVAIAAIDIGLTATDIVVAMNEQELSATPEGREFLEAWNGVMLAGGIVAGSAAVSALLTKGASLLSKVTTASARNFIKASMIKVILELNISGFTKNTLRIIEPTEIFKGFEYSQMGKRMSEKGVVFLSGNKEGKNVETYAALYKGKIIEEFTESGKHNFYKKWGRLKGDKLTEALESLVRVKILKLKPSWLPDRTISTQKNRTVTLLGNYMKDTKRVLEELEYPKSTNFGAKDGEFNLLNVPDEIFEISPDFFKEYNLPWLEQAAIRGDDFIILSDKFDEKLLYKSTGELTGFGKEIQFMEDLVNKGIYKFIKEQGKYIKIQK